MSQTLNNQKIVFLFLSVFAVSAFGYAQDHKQDQHQERLSKYSHQELAPQEVKRLYEMENNTHKLGRVAHYSKSRDGKTKTITTFENRKDSLVFKSEVVLTYNAQDSLVRYLRYSEVPTPKDTRLRETTFWYPNDSLTIEVETDGPEQTDSIYTFYKNNAAGRITLDSIAGSRTYKGYTHTNLNVSTQYNYSDGGLLFKKVRTSHFRGGKTETVYSYENKTLIRKEFRTPHETVVTHYEKGLVVSEERKSGDDFITESQFVYDDEGKEREEKKYENGSPYYTYKTTYNSAGKKTKFEMINARTSSTGIWLYEYDDENELKYKIDLYYRNPKPRKIRTVTPVAAAPK